MGRAEFGPFRCRREEGNRRRHKEVGERDSVAGKESLLAEKCRQVSNTVRALGIAAAIAASSGFCPINCGATMR